MVAQARAAGGKAGAQAQGGLHKVAGGARKAAGTATGKAGEQARVAAQRLREGSRKLRRKRPAEADGAAEAPPDGDLTKG